MSAPDNTNSTPTIQRVRRRNHELHVTFTGGRPMLVLPQAVNGRYQSRYSYGVSNAAVNVKPVHDR